METRTYSEVEGLYLNRNKDFRVFLEDISNKTGNKNRELWLKNLSDNRAIFEKSKKWATQELQDVERGKTAIIIGASPALRKQVNTLRNIQEDPDFILCGLSCNLEFLLNNAIKPKYVITVDADPSQADFWNNVEMEKTKNIPLLTSTFAYPPMLESWKGPLYFIGFQSTDPKIEKKQDEVFGLLNGIGEGFISLMGQFNIMAAFAFLCLGCPILLFVGNEMSFKNREERYYVDRDDPKDKEQRFPHGDIYGNIVYTTHGLLALKLSLEHFLEVVSGAGWFLNCSEAGIFGVTKRYPGYRVPWIQQFTLKNGIAQARQIMRTGKPFYA